MLKGKNTLGRDAVRLTMSKVIVSLINLLVGMLLSRFRTLEEYGTYSQMTLAINLFTTIFMLGMPNSLNYFLAKADTNLERKEFLSVYYTISTILSILVGGILVASLPLLVAYFDNPLLSTFWYYLALFPLTKIIGSGIENILVAYRRTDQVMRFRLANSLAIFGVILFVRWLNLNFRDYLLLYLGVEMVFSIVVYITAYRLADGLKAKLDFALIRKIFVFSIPIGLASMIGTLNIEIDKLMIASFLDTERLAIYTNASREMPVTLIATSITAVLLPQVVRLLKRNQNRDALALWGSAINLSFTVMSFCACVLFFFAPEVMTVLYSEKYLPGVPIFRVYSLGLLCHFTYVGMILNAAGKTKLIFYSSLASLCLNVLLNYIFFLLWGWIGPAIATLVSIVVIMFFQLVFSAKILEVRLSELFPWATMMRILIRQSLLGVGMYLAKGIFPLDGYICRIFAITPTMASVYEAILMGIVWIVFFALLELKLLKKSWKELNSAKLSEN